MSDAGDAFGPPSGPPIPTPLDLAVCVEASLHGSLDGFGLHRARLYGVTVVDPDGVRRGADGALRISFLAEHGDVYELLDAPGSAIARMFDAAVVLTCGWAAPVAGHGPEDDEPGGERDDEPDGELAGEPDGGLGDEPAELDVPPSAHPLRRRVRLVVAISDDGVASVLRFADAPDRVVTDAGAARGSLADAIETMWREPRVVVEREPG
jgi:hypothetical protein